MFSDSESKGGGRCVSRAYLCYVERASLSFRSLQPGTCCPHGMSSSLGDRAPAIQTPRKPRMWLYYERLCCEPLLTWLPGCPARRCPVTVRQEGCSRQDPGILPRPVTCRCSQSAGSKAFLASSSVNTMCFPDPQKQVQGPHLPDSKDPGEVQWRQLSGTFCSSV